MRIKYIAISIAILLCISANAGEYEVAVDAYRAGSYGKAFSVFKKLASSGNVDAQVDLGVMYVQGHGVPKNVREAVKWWAKAAEKGNNKAQAYLGGVYSSKTSGLLDYTKAFKYYSLSANQYDPVSQAILGYMYAEGQGVKKDINKAIELWRKSAMQGEEGAIKNLERARKLGIID